MWILFLIFSGLKRRETVFDKAKDEVELVGNGKAKDAPFKDGQLPFIRIFSSLSLLTLFPSVARLSTHSQRTQSERGLTDALPQKLQIFIFCSVPLVFILQHNFTMREISCP